LSRAINRRTSVFGGGVSARGPNAQAEDENEDQRQQVFGIFRGNGIQNRKERIEVKKCLRATEITGDHTYYLGKF